MKFKRYVIRKITKETNELYDEVFITALNNDHAKVWFDMIKQEATDLDRYSYELRSYGNYKTGKRIIAQI